MRIAYLAVDVDISLPRGSSTHTVELAESLHRQGHEVVLFVRRGSRTQARIEKRGAISIRRLFRGIVAPLRETHSPRRSGEVTRKTKLIARVYAAYLRTAYALYCILRIILDVHTEPPEIILERGSCLGIGAIVACLIRRPLVAEIIDPNHSAVSLKKALGVIAYTRKVLKIDVPPDRLRLVEAAVNTTMFRVPDTNSSEIRSQLGLGEGFIVGYVGIFEAWHGTEVIQQASTQLLPFGVRFLLVGPGYERMAGGLDRSIESSFIFTGGVSRENVPNLVSSMDLTLAPFLERGPRMQEKGYYFSPLKIFEYAACGKPIIASDLEMIRKAMPEAIFVPPGNSNALAADIAKVLENRVWAKRQGAKARRMVIAHHSWDMFAKDLVMTASMWEERRKDATEF